MFRKNVAGQFIHFQGVDVSTGGTKSGVTWTVRRCIDGTFADATGTATEDGTTGWYKFAMSQADTNGNNIGFNFTGTGAIPQTVNIVTTDLNPYDSVRAGLTALPNAAADAAGGLPISDAGGLDLDARLDAAISSRMATYTQPTGFLAATFPTDPADQSLIIAATDAIIAAIAALNNLAQADIRTAVGLGAANLDTQLADLPTNSELATALGTADDAVLAAIGSLNNLSAAQVNAEVDQALSDYDGPTYTELLNLFRLALRKDSAIATDLAALLTAINADLASGGGAFANTTDALEALRDRGDSAWITATGFSTLDAAGVRAAVGLDAANLDTQLSGIQNDTDDIQTRIPAALTANGNMKSSLVEILATALTETSGQIAAAFKKFFNIAAPAATMDHLVLVDTVTTYTGNTPQTADVADLITTVGVAGAGLTAINLPDQTMNITGNITGNLSGSVGSVTGLTASNLDAAVSSRATPAQILTTALTEAYAADGVAPTLSQLLFLVQQVLTEASVAGTTMTVKKLDGSTTAATFTLDDNTAPTSITRST